MLNMRHIRLIGYVARCCSMNLYFSTASARRIPLPFLKSRVPSATVDSLSSVALVLRPAHSPCPVQTAFYSGGSGAYPVARNTPYRGCGAAPFHAIPGSLLLAVSANRFARSISPLLPHGAMALNSFVNRLFVWLISSDMVTVLPVHQTQYDSLPIRAYS